MQSDQENRNKEKNKAIDSIVSKREKIHQKMQLWSNAYENEYALRLTIANADDDYDKLEDTFVKN